MPRATQSGGLGAPLGAYTWHHKASTFPTYRGREELLKPAQWDSRDRELLSFHYPKGSVTVRSTCHYSRTLRVCVCGGEGVQAVFSLTDLQAGEASKPDLQTAGHLEILL